MDKEISFSVKVTTNDMYVFLLRHYFSHFGGWFGVVFAIALFVLAGVTFGNVPTMYTILYVVIGLFVIVYPFTGMRRRAQNQVKADALKDSLTYVVTDKQLRVLRTEQPEDDEEENGAVSAQKPLSQSFTWKEIYRVIETDKQLIVYVNTIHAFIWPKEQLGDTLPALKALLQKTLSVRQSRLK